MTIDQKFKHNQKINYINNSYIDSKPKVRRKFYLCVELLNLDKKTRITKAFTQDSILNHRVMYSKKVIFITLIQHIKCTNIFFLSFKYYEY